MRLVLGLRFTGPARPFDIDQEDLDVSPKSEVAVNKEIIRRVFEDFVNTGDYSLVDEVYRPDMVDHQALPGAPEGLDGVRYTIAGLRAGFPDLHVTIEEMSAHRDNVVVHNTWRGTHLGEFLGIAPTGRKVEFSGVVVWRLQDGLIAERWGIGVEGTLVAELGLGSLAPGARPGRYRRGETPTARQAFALSLENVPAWRELDALLSGARMAEFQASRRRVGAVRESFSCQYSDGGALVLQTLEARDPGRAARRLTTSKDPFDLWLSARAKEILGVDPWLRIAEGETADNGLDWCLPVDLSRAQRTSA